MSWCLEKLNKMKTEKGIRKRPEKVKKLQSLKSHFVGLFFLGLADYFSTDEPIMETNSFVCF